MPTEVLVCTIFTPVVTVCCLHVCIHPILTASVAYTSAIASMERRAVKIMA